MKLITLSLFMIVLVSCDENYIGSSNAGEVGEWVFYPDGPNEYSWLVNSKTGDIRKCKLASELEGNNCVLIYSASDRSREDELRNLENQAERERLLEAIYSRQEELEDAERGFEILLRDGYITEQEAAEARMKADLTIERGSN